MKRKEDRKIESGIYQSPREAAWKGTWWRQGGVTPSDFLWGYTIVPRWWSGCPFLTEGQKLCRALSWFQWKEGQSNTDKSKSQPFQFVWIFLTLRGFSVAVPAFSDDSAITVLLCFIKWFEPRHSTENSRHVDSKNIFMHCVNLR